MTQKEAFTLLAARLEHARATHPVFAEYTHDAVDVIRDEWRELHSAVHYGEGPQRVLDEALDVAATAMRLVMGEVQA